jgi:GNAT superfamily N-acetyltransferase
MKDIKIERIKSEACLTICAKVLVSAYNNEPWNDNWTQEKALEKLTCFYNSPKFIGWKVSKADQIIGCCVGNIEPYYTGDYYYLKEMFVTFEFQNKGIGNLMMETLLAHLKEIEINQIILFTGKDFYPYDFYLKKGFEVMDDMRMMHFGND